MTIWNEFAPTLARFQNRLYAYTLSLVGEPTAAEDILQQVNVVLCRKADQFTPGTDFMAWACAVVRFEIMAYRKNVSRDRLVFDLDTLELLEAEAEPHLGRIEATTVALHECIKRLNHRQRTILESRYVRNDKVQTIAQTLSMTANAVDQALFRIRKALASCIRARLSEERS